MKKNYWLQNKSKCDGNFQVNWLLRSLVARTRPTIDKPMFESQRNHNLKFFQVFHIKLSRSVVYRITFTIVNNLKIVQSCLEVRIEFKIFTDDSITKT